MTRRLYYEDEYMRSFDAHVISCERKGDRYEICLDQTAFFPEGGGQWPDLGTLEDVHVLDVHERNNEVVHTTDAPLEAGQQIHGEIDWNRRFSVMQQHSGEHIFSGLVHKHYGYDNVGFHIGSEAVTMDFNGPLSMDQALQIEREVNQIIWDNRPIKHFIATEEERESLPYRSKKHIDGDLRIVQIPDADICACCGTHVRTTGCIGQVKLLGVMKYKSGVRVSILCGVRALEYEDEILKEMDNVRILLSSKENDTAQAVSKLLEERKQLKYELEKISLQLFEKQAEGEYAKTVRVVHCETLSPDATARACGRLAEGAGIAMVTSGTGETVNFAICSSTMDVRPLTRTLCQTMDGKGGGKPDMTQGKIRKTPVEELRACLNCVLKET